jgi:DNA-binding response OmpR family regulator
MKRLLVIEDDEPIADLLERGLRLAGYEVVIETDGQAGLERWTLGGLAAVILDVMLPGANGLDIATERRAAGDRTPVLLLTARDDATRDRRHDGQAVRLSRASDPPRRPHASGRRTGSRPRGPSR